MKRIAAWKWLALALFACLAASRPSAAATVPVFFDTLNASATVATPLNGGDTLFVDTLVTTEVGALLQSVTFTVGAGVTSFFGAAAWEVTPNAVGGPRLIGVNIDIFDSSNVLLYTDAFQGVLGSFAISNFEGPLGPGTYTMIATGTGVRASSLDISLTFAPIPEPSVLLLSAAGLAGLAALGRRRQPAA